LWAFLGVTLGIAAAVAGPSEDRGDGLDEGPGPLPWRVSGPLGFTVDAASFPDSAGEVLEVYVRVPPAALTSRVSRASLRSRLSVSIRLRNRFGARQHDAVQEFRVSAEDTASFGKVVMERFRTVPGRYRVQVKVEDPDSRKRGLVYVGRTVREGASVEGEVEVPGPQAARRFSDLEFVWTEAPQGLGRSFRRPGAPQASPGLVPNPERLYGLFADQLRTFFEAWSARPEPGPWHWTARILDAHGRMVAGRDSTAAAGPSLSQTVAFDVATQPAGGYDLEVRAWQEGDRDTMARRARFGIAWQPGSWKSNPQDTEDAVHFLLDTEQEDAFGRMNAGEQERFLEEFWRLRDPTPGTAENEARAEFLARIEHANQTWKRVGQAQGMFSDMGRVYIRYGEPDEILRQVIPAGDQTLSQLLQELQISEDRSLGSVAKRGPGGDTRPFEVWVYEGEDRSAPGATLAPPARHQRRLFLFVDEQGVGDYRLRYSTE
jgi:GWxTD domain-containing protein